MKTLAGLERDDYFTVTFICPIYVEFSLRTSIIILSFIFRKSYNEGETAF